MNHLKTLSLKLVREGGRRKGNTTQRHSHDKEEQGPVGRNVEEGRDICSPERGMLW